MRYRTLIIFTSSSDSRPFVIKPVSEKVFKDLDEFKSEFKENSRLRNHVDQADKDKIVIYDFFNVDLRSLTDKYPSLPLATKKVMLKEIAIGLNDMHEQDWVHLGT